MRKLLILFVLTLTVAAQAVTKVSCEQLQQSGWASYQGQRIRISTPLIVCGTFRDTIILAPERLYVPEERAVGLNKGDSSRYWQIAKDNAAKQIKLVCRKPYDLNLGATVRGLEGNVTDYQTIQTGQHPRFKNYKPSKKIPSVGNADILVCATNIQNYFVHVGGYATKRNTPGQHAFQCYKTASALCQINADLYALCEIEKGPSAPAELTDKMNKLAKKDIYAFVRTAEDDGDTISVGFIYRKDRIRPVGELLRAYTNRSNIYSNRFMLQGFEHIRSGEQFVLSLNHPRSKRGAPQLANAKRMDNINHILSCINAAYADSTYTDPDILLLGDYNCYRYEEPIQTLVEAGYADMLTDTMDYSYSYHGLCGSLDRVFASPTMATQITGVKTIHWNTDYYYSAAYYSKYNFLNNSIPKEAPADIRKCLSKAAKRNLLFRYSDHDPVLIGLKLK